MVNNNASNWVFTGSSVSGCGYGYRIFRDDAALGIRHAVQLAFEGHRMMVSVETYSAAHELGQAFCHACRQWQVVQNRKRALEQGFAVLG